MRCSHLLKALCCLAPLVALGGCGMSEQTSWDNLTYAQKRQMKAQAVQNCMAQGVPKSELSACAANDLGLRQRQIDHDKDLRNTGIAVGTAAALGGIYAVGHNNWGW